jgi:hypothetical protein
MRFLAFLILSALSARAAQAASACSISVSAQPSQAAIGATLRDPASSPYGRAISIPVSIACPSPQLIEIASQGGQFAASGSPQLVAPYRFRLDGIAPSAFVSPQPGGAFIALGQMLAPSASGRLLIHSAKVANLQAGLYSDLITIRVGGPGGQSVPVPVAGLVPADCAVSFGDRPSDAAIGDILARPAGRAILVPVSFSCNTYQARVDASASGGGFAHASDRGAPVVKYHVSLSPGALTGPSAVIPSALISGGRWAPLGNLRGPQASASLVIAPDSPAGKAGAYAETISLRVNAP